MLSKVLKTALVFQFLYISIAFAESKKTEPTKVEVDQSGNQSQEWATIQGNLSDMRGKIIVEQRILEEQLNVGKAGGGRLSAEQVKSIKDHHKKLSDMTNDYNELLNKFELRFPERGQQMGRKYFRIDNLTLEQIENRMTLEDRRNSLIKKIRTQYNKPESDDTTQRPFDPNRDKRPEVTDQIILVK